MRRVLKIFVGIGLSVIVFLIFGALIFIFYLNAFSTDGPFMGEAREDCNLLNSPKQVLGVSPAIRVEVYERKGDDPAPTVLLRDGNNEIKWCVYAVADSLSEVYDIEFHRYEPWFILGKKVEGIVHWTYGYEWDGWYLGPLDWLVEYYYDW